LFREEIVSTLAPMQPTSMRAIAKLRPGPGLHLTEAPMPSPGPNDVLIKVKKTSICGTDVHIYNWDAWAEKTIRPPMVIGHEFMGVIAEVGSNVQGFQPGDLVDGEGRIVCGRCRNCLAGRRHLCKDTRGVGVNPDGAFAEYFCIPATNAVHVDPAIPLDVLSCFDPPGNAAHTALQYDLVGEDVLITGAGPIRCMAVAIAKQAGARKVVVTDVNPDRLCKAQRYRYRNCDPADLEAQFRAADAAGARFKRIVTDGVFSMDGLIAPLREICALAGK
jgi:threonine 3-dehydrogenase